MMAMETGTRLENTQEMAMDEGTVQVDTKGVVLVADTTQASGAQQVGTTEVAIDEGTQQASTKEVASAVDAQTSAIEVGATQANTQGMAIAPCR